MMGVFFLYGTIKLAFKLLWAMQRQGVRWLERKTCLVRSDPIMKKLTVTKRILLARKFTLLKYGYTKIKLCVHTHTVHIQYGRIKHVNSLSFIVGFSGKKKQHSVFSQFFFFPRQLNYSHTYRF